MLTKILVNGCRNVSKLLILLTGAGLQFMLILFELNGSLKLYFFHLEAELKHLFAVIRT
jgi:hypothetical protein